MIMDNSIFDVKGVKVKKSFQINTSSHVFSMSIIDDKGVEINLALFSDKELKVEVPEKVERY